MHDGLQQLASTGAENLDAEAKQDEGRESHSDIGAARTQKTWTRSA
jgi:hypothetical protein